MPLSSKITHLSELKQVLSKNDKLTEGVVDYISRFDINRLCKPFEVLKQKGISVSETILCLILLHLTSHTITSLLNSDLKDLSDAAKDSYYRLKNNPKVDWRRLLLLICRRFNQLIADYTEAGPENRPKCFIIDDTTLGKTGKAIENIGRVFDHVTKRHILGFKLLVLGFWDGKSFLGLDFSLHREKGNTPGKPFGLSAKEKKGQYHKERDKKSCGYIRAKELDKSKITNAIEMIKRAVKNGFIASYVLCDTWFMNEELIRQIRQIKSGAMHVLGMCRMDKRLFSYNGREYNANTLLKKRIRKNIKRARKVKAQYIELVAEYKGHTVKLFFSRFHGTTKWHLILTTDLSLNYLRALEIYQIRWSIEVFFREGKQYLSLGKCQSNDFDAQIAEITICMVTYLILNLQKRTTCYETIGGIFKESQRHFLEITLWERFWGLLIELVSQIAVLFDIEIEEILSKIFSDTKTEDKIIRLLNCLADEKKVA